MRRVAVHRIQRFFVIISFVALFAIIIIVARLMNMGVDWSEFSISEYVTLPVPVPVINARVALISGHAGYDSGATCADADGKTTLTEADITADIAARVADLLRRDGTEVAILNEYDPAINNLEADVLLSLHADSCINASGYKAAYYLYSTIPEQDARLVECIDLMYGQETGLERHADTITHNMTEYHAFRKVASTTPAAILELGFLGGDGEILTTDAKSVALGVADSIRCFLDDEPQTPPPSPTETPAAATTEDTAQ